MSRLHMDFGCGTLKCAGTLDTAPGTSGLLIVSGGNEIRSGAFGGQAKLAAKVAKAGFPVFRFDRRGIGDSEGENRGFRKSKGDIKAAIHAFQAIAPQVDRIIGFGNCDAASALMLARGAECDGLILSNPWTIEDDDSDSTPPADVIRARYFEKLKNPGEITRLLSGGVNLRKLAKGLGKSVASAQGQTGLADEMRAGISEFAGTVRFLLANDDRTAQVFTSNWDMSDPRIARCEGASHAYVEPHAEQWLREQILGALRA